MQNKLYFSKVAVFGQGGCNLAKLVAFGKSCCIRVKWMYLVKMFYSGKSGCIKAKVVVFGHSGCIPEKVVVNLAKWL